MTKITQAVCIHGHFYQPPRENPWLEEIEIQDSAHPYHDWNDRITAECYARNAAARILDDEPLEAAAAFLDNRHSQQLEANRVFHALERWREAEP